MEGRNGAEGTENKYGKDKIKVLAVNGVVFEEVEQLCCLGDVLDCDARVERAVPARVTAAWRRWRKIASLLVNCSIGLRTKGRVYEACVRSALLYGAESWALSDGCFTHM